MSGTPLASESGRIRDTQVVIGRRADAGLDMAAIHAARFIPPPPGDHLTTGLHDLVPGVIALPSRVKGALVDSGTALPVDIAAAKEQAHGLGLFIRSLVGLDHQAAVEAFGEFLDGSRFSADQIRFIDLIVSELTRNGVVEPARLYESPYVDHAPTGPDDVFEESDVETIVAILNTVKTNAAPVGPAA